MLQSPSYAVPFLNKSSTLTHILVADLICKPELINDNLCTIRYSVCSLVGWISAWSQAGAVRGRVEWRITVICQTIPARDAGWHRIGYKCQPIRR